MDSTLREPQDDRLQRLVQGALPGARIVAVESLGPDAAPRGATTKGTGYGAPLRIDVVRAGERRSLVLHTATANPFGHDRRADRAAEVILAADSFVSVPRHVRALDVGAFRGEDEVVSLRETGEFYLLTDWADGALYAESLRRVLAAPELEASDLERVDRLADYLVTLHAERVAVPFARERALRDLLGSGEGIFGIVDGYPADSPGAPRARLQRIEERCLAWRWRMKGIERPLVRIHGDFHPFNIVFDARGELGLLDTSRGSLGEAADDVSCLALNYPFFALGQADVWQRAFSRLWSRFWSRYLEGSRDDGLFDVVAPFLAWRGLVLANPAWYPRLAPASRARLLDFVEVVLEAKRFSPELAEGMFS